MSVLIDGAQLRQGFLLGADLLTHRKETLNQLNIFPVADRDTGINMERSMKKTAANLPSEGTPAQIAEQAYMQLLEFAHGNSGTILTLFFEGFACGLPADALAVSAGQLADALLKGAQTAMSGVADPMSGTILTVAMQSAHAGVSMAEITGDAAVVFRRIVEEAHAALMQTALQNPVLRPYRVVDSGAYGFCLILDGFLAAIAPDFPPVSYSQLILPDCPAPEEAELLHRYCTEFVLEPAEAACLDEMEDRLRCLGDYFLCVKNGTLCKVHIHTNVPDEVLQIAASYGVLRSQKVDDMTAQV